MQTKQMHLKRGFINMVWIKAATEQTVIRQQQLRETIQAAYHPAKIIYYSVLNLTLYSGSCRRKKQARTSSQWKLPLWVPIFLTVMLSVQRFFAWLDMYRGSMRVTSTESKRQQLACELNRKKTLAGLLKFIWDVILVKLIAAVRTHNIQTRLHTRRTGSGQIWQLDRMWCIWFNEPKEPEERGSELVFSSLYIFFNRHVWP